MAKKTSKFDDILKSIEKDFGKNSLVQFGKAEALDIDAISTGSINLDNAIGIGGVARGRVTEIFGKESSGKTTICLSVVANAQKSGGKVAYIDVENALDPKYCKILGVDINKLYVSQPDCGEDALTIAHRLIESEEFSVIVIDSVSALVPRAEIEGAIGDSHMGLAARLMSQSLRMISKVIKTSNTAVIFINQTRQKIGVTWGSNVTTSGGEALKFYSSTRLQTSRIGMVKNGDEVIGSKIKVKVVKNKVAPPFKEAEFEIWYDRGIYRNAELLEMAIKNKVIEKSGSWFSMDGNNIGQGSNSVLEKMDTDEKFRKDIESKVFKNENIHM